MSCEENQLRESTNRLRSASAIQLNPAAQSVRLKENGMGERRDQWKNHRCQKGLLVTDRAERLVNGLVMRFLYVQGHREFARSLHTEVVPLNI